MYGIHLDSNCLVILRNSICLAEIYPIIIKDKNIDGKLGSTWLSFRVSIM